MMRVLYAWLLRRHPRGFRERFEVEMLESFDEAAERGLLSGFRLVGDGFASLLRQWVLRPEARGAPAVGEAAVSAGPALAGGGVPVFYQFDDYRLRRVAVMEGVACSAGLFAAALVFMGAGGILPQGWTIGSADRRPRPLTVSRRSIATARPGTSVRAPVQPPTALETFAAQYFAALTVLGALDTDGDWALSRAEIGQAPVVLAGLDANHDGRLSAVELGFRVPREMVGPASWARMEREFMGQHPVPRVLDADADLELSAAEIQGASQSLLLLDVSGNGRLGTVELIPDPVLWDILVGLPRR